MSLIYLIEDEPLMAGCLELAVQSADAQAEVQIFSNAITAMEQVNRQLPDLILLDVLLAGPDGFTLLNELLSYRDTARIPIVIVSSLDLSQQDLSHYGVVAVLDKTKMTPATVGAAVKAALKGERNDVE